MGVSGNHTRYVSVGKESSFGSAVAAEAVGEVESEGFQQIYDVLKREDMNYYGSAKAVISRLYSEGSITMALQPDDFTLMLLHGIMGEDAPGGSASDTRTFTENLVNSTAQLPSYTFRVGRDDKEHIFPGQVIESISVSSSIGEYAMMTVNTVGQKQSSATATLGTAVPSYTGDAAHFHKAFVRFEAAASTSAHSNLVQSIDFEIKTNRDVDNSYNLSEDTCVRPPPSTMREVSGSITFHKALLTSDVADNEVFFDELRPGTANVVNPSSTTPALSVLFEVDSNHFIRFDFAKLIYEMPETSVSGRDSQTMSVSFHGLYDLGEANNMVKITAKSTDGQANYDA
tara:strand:+ start:913 stop:1941 length:1029 start_codon:yes stop_codon:yes gene_type:complete